MESRGIYGTAQNSTPNCLTFVKRLLLIAYHQKPEALVHFLPICNSSCSYKRHAIRSMVQYRCASGSPMNCSIIIDLSLWLTLPAQRHMINPRRCETNHLGSGTTMPTPEHHLPPDTIPIFTCNGVPTPQTQLRSCQSLSKPQVP